MDRFPRAATDPETKLGPRDRRFLWFCVALSALTLTIGFWLYPKVNPEASIRFDVDRRSSEAVAARFLRDVGCDPAGFRHAARFTYEDDAKVFLERSLGLARANELMSGPVRMWRWGHRWFRSLEKEEFSVDVSVQGSVTAFAHLIPEEAPGASLAPDSAKALAERFLSGSLGIERARLTYEGVETRTRPARVDHTFTWKRTDLMLAEGDLRYEVGIQGDAPGAFREYVRIPESWARDYGRLRSLNDSAGMAASALSILLFIGALIVLFLRLRGRDLCWRPALTYGGLGVVLAFLASLNRLPNSFYDYETTASLGGFLSRQLIQGLLSALLLGMFIFLLAAAGESLYRERYPGQVSLGRLFSRRALRTRRFLLQGVLGLAMTCFFFCYQEVFYSVAQRFGAWAPLEVPYDDLLNTLIPWAFILLIGFMPAVTEEFGFRLFPIPFLQRHLRSRWLALTIPAFIWGFAHSSYPNQPFFIRGLEVGLAGVLVGAIMLRFGILAPLVWHYTVDALYSSTLLFRSGNPYYIISAALAGGVILLPLIWAAIAYLRSGRFEDPSELTNAAESERRRPSGAAPGEEAQGRLSLPPPVTGPEAERETEVRPWSARRRLQVLALGVGGAALLLLPGERIEVAREIRLGRAEALAVGRGALAALGESPDSFHANVTAGDRLDPLVARYLLEQGGVDPLRRRLSEWSPPLRWRARFFRPLEAREIAVEVDAASGRVVSLRRHVAEKDSLPEISSTEAELAARTFLTKQGIDLAALALRDVAEEKRPHRVDRGFLFEARDGDPRNVGEAKHRVRVVMTGDRVGAWSDSLELPEEWVRRREKETLWTSLGSILPLIAFGGLAGLLLWQFVRAQRERRVPWRRCLWGAMILSLLSVAGGINDWPIVLSRYSTAIPWDVFRFTGMIGVGLGVVVNFLIFTLSLAVAASSWPASLAALSSSRGRRRGLPDALLAAAAALAVVLGTRHLAEVALRLRPEIAPLPRIGLPRSAEGVILPLAVVWTIVRFVVLVVGVGAGLLALAHGRSRSLRAWGILVLLWLGLAVPGARSVGELGLALLLSGVQLAAILCAARLVLPGNPLAWILSVLAIVTTSTVWPYLTAAGEGYRRAGGVALFCIGVPVLLWALGWPAGRRKAT